MGTHPHARLIPFVNSTPAASGRLACVSPFRGKPRGLARGNLDDVASSERDVATADLPPFTTARRISAAATGLSCWQTTTSTKLSIAKRKGADIAFAPVDVQCHRPRNGEHFGTEIDAGDMPGTINPLF